ncbi:MAG: hypothetical protein ACJ798_09390 [Phenylobacterium sp.]
MAFIPAWRNFKRMQDLTVAAASLIYAAAVVNAVGRLPGGEAMVLRWTLLWPAAFLGFSLGIPLLIAPLKRWLAKYVWLSFQAGFGQTPGSVVVGIGLLLGAGLFIWRQVSHAAATGQVGVNVFACYAAGIGILAAQAILVRALEQTPDVREQIVEKG